MVSADGIADVRFFLVFLRHLHAQQRVRQLGIFLADLADIVQQAGALGRFGIEAQFRGHRGADIGHLAGVLQQVLSIGTAVLHAADQADKLRMQAMDAQIDASALASLHDLIVQLLAHLFDHLFDAGRMDTAVGHQLMQGQAGHFAANRIERREEDCFGRIVHHDLDTRSCFERTDVAAFPADDTALDLVVVDVEHRHGVFDGRFRGGTLNGVDHNALGFLGGVQPGLVHHLVDIRHGLGTGLGLHVLDQLVLGIGCSHAGHLFQFLDHLATEFLVLVLFLADDFHLVLEVLPDGIDLLLLAADLGVLLIEAELALLELVLQLERLRVAVVDIRFVFTFELKELFLGLEDLLFLDGLAFCFGILENLLFLALQYEVSDQDAAQNAQSCRNQCV